MQLTSGLFVAFLCLVCLTAYIVPRRVRYVWLLLCSYAFYILYDADNLTKNLPALALLLCATLISWGCALGIGASRKVGGKRLFLALSLAACLGMLLVCKYTNFFAESLEGLTGLFGSGMKMGRVNFIWPLGLSYYTLQTVSYSIEVYTGGMPAERNLVRYALYVSFFPGLVVGPINRAGDMLPQYKDPRPFDYDRVSGGFFRVLWGFVKKMVIADSIAVFTGDVFKHPEDFWGPQMVLAILLFAYQLYADFSGCCDIAIGAARMLGFDFMENFERPFAAKTFQLLWQRWHISLTSFFRDYVFTPLVWSRWTEKLPFIGQKVQKPPALSSVFIIFLLSGLWHGPSINYVIWGVLNGLIMVLSTKFGKKKEKLAARVPVYKNRYLRGTVQRILVYLMFAGCLTFFAFAMYGTGVGEFFTSLPQGWGALFRGTLAGNFLPLSTVIMLAVGVLVLEGVEHFAVRPGSSVASWVRTRKWWLRWPLYYALLSALLVFGSFGKSPFIYQQL